jgi:hypothetical protein
MRRTALGCAAAIAATTITFAIPASGAETCPDPASLPSSFVSAVDHPYMPLTPGTTFVYKGKLDRVAAKDVFTVTDQTKTIQGVVTTVVRDQVFTKGRLSEDTLDWFAQDADGNVWYFGEDTRQLDKNGNVISTEGSWQAGESGNRAGIFLPAAPAVGQTFKAEDAPGVAEDCTEIADLHASVESRFVSSSDSLKTREFSLLEPGVVDNKYYVRGIGLVREQTIQGGTDVLELVSVQSTEP